VAVWYQGDDSAFATTTRFGGVEIHALMDSMEFQLNRQAHKQ
jgi:hypothetical protein